MYGMASDLFFDYSRYFAQFASDEREINFLDCALGKLSGQFAVRCIIFRNDETTACFFVEAMNDARPFFSADSRQRHAMTEQCIDQSVFPMTSARMNDKPSGFIDDDEIVVFKENIEWNRLRLILDLFQRRLGHFDFITDANKMARPRSRTVEPNESSADQLLDTRARIAREFLNQKTIKANLCLVFWHDELELCRIFRGRIQLAAAFSLPGNFRMLQLLAMVLEGSSQ
jgi:hypothetical protein